MNCKKRHLFGDAPTEYLAAIKKIASRLVASGAARKPFAYWEDMHLAMCHDARFYAKAKRIE